MTKKKVVQLSTPKTDLMEIIDNAENHLFVGSNGKQVSISYDFKSREDFAWLAMVLLLECMQIANDQMTEGHDEQQH